VTPEDRDSRQLTFRCRATFREQDLAGLGSLYIGWEHHFGAETRGPGSSFTTIRLTLNFALKVAVCAALSRIFRQSGEKAVAVTKTS